MKKPIVHAALVAALASLSVATSGACTADIHDNTFNVDATLDFKADVDVSHVKPGDSIAVSMETTGVVLVDPDKEPTAAEADTAGYFEIFLDDADSTPLLITAKASAQVTIPSNASEGKHSVICRLHKHNGTPTSYQKQFSIEVMGSVMVGSADAG